MPASPGWYQDPAGHPVLRYWDGIAWTAQVRQPDRPQSRRRYSGLALSALVVAVLGLVLTLPGVIYSLTHHTSGVMPMSVPGALLALGGIVIGIVGFSATGSGGKVGRPFAVAGIVIGAVALLLLIVTLL
jgi:hypothetical protein